MKKYCVTAVIAAAFLMACPGLSSTSFAADIQLLLSKLFFSTIGSGATSEPSMERYIVGGSRSSISTVVDGGPWIRFDEGRELPTTLRGANSIISSLRSNHPQPLAITSADFDEDGMPDVVTGFDNGMIVLHFGNSDAVYPKRGNGSTATPAFMEEGRVFQASRRADFLAPGDFNVDGHLDLAAASKGSDSLTVLLNDGRGGFAANELRLDGSVTAMTSGEMNRADGINDLIVATSGEKVPDVQVWECPAGIFACEPETFELPDVATSLALGRISGGPENDLVVASGNELVTVAGRDRRLTSGEVAKNAVPGAQVTSQSFPFGIRTLTVGRFGGGRDPELAILSYDGFMRTLRPGRNRESSDYKITSELSAGDFDGSLVKARVSSRPGDDLVAIDRETNALKILESNAGSLELAASFQATDAPVAILPMRLNSDGINDLVILRRNSVAPTVMLSSPISTFTVTNTADAGPGSLRQAIEDSNDVDGADLINFNIPGDGVQTINLESQLPIITEPVTIDGYTQPGSSPNTLTDSDNAVLQIELRGPAPTGAQGILINRRDSVIRGLVLNNFTSHAIDVFTSNGGNCIVEGNFVGTDATGLLLVGNGAQGITAQSTDSNTIGGTAPAARNVIAGNRSTGVDFLGAGADDNTVLGNFIGVGADGTTPIAHPLAGGATIGVRSALNTVNNTIGGTAPGSRNIISGNYAEGVEINGNNVLVQGNYIGTDVTGTLDVGNASPAGTVGGVQVASTAGNITIGGTTPAARNVISGSGNGTQFSNSHGVILNSTGAGVIVQGNYIGTAANGIDPVGNDDHGIGIGVGNGTGNTIVGGDFPGQGNVIAFNGQAGVHVGNAVDGNSIRGNSIFDNGGLGIDLFQQVVDVNPNDNCDGDTGANIKQNYPVITNVTVSGGSTAITGTLNSVANNTYWLDFYSSVAGDVSGHGEGKTYLGFGSVTTEIGSDLNPCTGEFTIILNGTVPDGVFFTSTATDPQNNTSEFSAHFEIDPFNQPPDAVDDVATVAEDSGATVIDVLANDTDPDGNPLTITAVTQPANGNVVNNGNNVSFTPDANFNGSDSFDYTISDGNSGSDIATVNVTVTSVNDNPDAVNDSATVAEDTANNVINVLVNDSFAPDTGETLTITGNTPAANGTVVCSASSCTYTPNANYFGPDSFDYTISDGNGGSDTAIVSITVNDKPEANQPPDAVNDLATVVEDSADNVINVLENDNDPDNDPLTITDNTPASNGTPTCSASSCTYTPNANFSGSDSFTYTISDGQGGTDTGTVNITVTPVDDDPLAVADIAVVTEDSSDNGIDVLANDTDIDGGPRNIDSVTQPANGTIVNNGTDVLYTPNANYCNSQEGAVNDSFTYTLAPGGSSTSVSVAVTCVNDAPVAVNDNYGTDEDTVLNAAVPGVLGNDTDVENNPLTAVLVSSTSNGTLELNADGSFTYTPNTNFNGGDSFSYKANDGSLDSAPAIVNINITAVNDVPTATSQTVTVAEDTSVQIAVQAADVDNGNLIFKFRVPSNGTLGLINVDCAPEADGSIVCTANINYTPDPDYNGPDSITFEVFDGQADSETATISITVTEVNDVPVAQSDNGTTNEDTTLVLDGSVLLANDSRGPANEAGQNLVITAVGLPAHGSAEIVDGNIQYVPIANYNGPDTFTYTITDNGTTNGVPDPKSATATVHVTVAPINDAPGASDHLTNVSEDSSATLPVEVIDIDGDALTFSVGTGASNGEVGEFHSVTCTPQPDGSSRCHALIGYEPAPDYNGPDSFTFIANDGTTNSSPITMSITVEQVNDAPTAPTINRSGSEGNAISISISELVAAGAVPGPPNEVGQTLTLQSVSNPSNGTAAIIFGASILYSPQANFNGTDSFTYTLADNGTTHGVADPKPATATIFITINPVNDQPVAADGFYSTLMNADVQIDLGALVADIETADGALIYPPPSPPANGTLLGTGQFITYRPNTGFTGTDSFTYSVIDRGDPDNCGTPGPSCAAALQSATRIVTISVNPPANTAPTASGDSAEIKQNTSAALTLSARDAERQQLGFEIASGPQFGSLSQIPTASCGVLPRGGRWVCTAGITYTPGTNFYGQDRFTYRAYDGFAYSDPVDVRIRTKRMSKILYSSRHEDNDMEIYVINDDGSGNRRITFSPGSDTDPSWSPDESHIVFSSSRQGGAEDLYIMNSNGTGAVNITNSPENDSDPAWAPNGEEIAFTRRLGTNNEVFLLHLATNTFINLTQHPASDFDPTWAPDGRRLAFVSSRDNGSDIWALRFGRFGGLAQLTNNQLSSDLSPDWGPGGMIAFSRGTVQRLFVLDVNGGNTIEMTPEIGFGPLDPAQPSWSPDGSRIAYVRCLVVLCTQSDIYINLGVGNSVPLTSHASRVKSPDWGPLSAQP